MRSRLGGYAFAALTVLALYVDMTGPAVFCGIATALTWKGTPVAPVTALHFIE